MVGKEDSNESVTKVCSTVLALPPSCIEFSSVARDYFVVGTYNLQREEDEVVEKDSNGKDEDGNEISKENEEAQSSKKQQSRTGSLILFKIVEEKLTLVQALPHPSAILDLHFSPHHPTTFSIASSTGTFSSYTLSPSDPNKPDCDLSMVHKSTSQLFPTDTLITSFAFHPYDRELTAVTLSTGTIHLFKNVHQSPTNPTIVPSSPIITHTLEAWCVAFSPELRPLSGGVGKSDRTIYSGGDDARLRWATLQDTMCSPEDAEIESSCPPRGLPGHEAGVTAILPLPCLATPEITRLLLTGSYDDHIRVFDARNRGPSKVLSELYIGGGVWRLKFLEEILGGSGPGVDMVTGEVNFVFRVLASCMHAGARVLEVRGKGMWDLGLAREGMVCGEVTWSEWSIRVLGSFEEHKSMNYGSDVQPIKTGRDGKVEDKGRLCVSTSFYDRLLCVWRFKERGLCETAVFKGT